MCDVQLLLVVLYNAACSDAFAAVMQQWQKSVVRQQKMLQKTVLSRFIPVEGDPRLHIRGLQAQEFRGLMNQLCVAGKEADGLLLCMLT